MARLDAVAALSQRTEHLTREFGIRQVEGLGRADRARHDAVGPVEKRAAQVVGLELRGGVKGVHEPELVAGAGDGHVPALLHHAVGAVGLLPEGKPGRGGVNEREDHDVALVALEFGRNAAVDAAALDLARVEVLDEQAADAVDLRAVHASHRDDAEGLAVVGGIMDHRTKQADDGLGLLFVDAVVARRAAGAPGHHRGLEARGRGVAKRPDRAVVGKAAAPTDDFGHGAEVLDEHVRGEGHALHEAVEREPRVVELGLLDAAFKMTGAERVDGGLARAHGERCHLAVVAHDDHLLAHIEERQRRHVGLARLVDDDHVELRGGAEVEERVLDHHDPDGHGLLAGGQKPVDLAPPGGALAAAADGALHVGGKREEVRERGTVREPRLDGKPGLGDGELGRRLAKVGAQTLGVGLQCIEVRGGRARVDALELAVEPGVRDFGRRVRGREAGLARLERVRPLGRGGAKPFKKLGAAGKERLVLKKLPEALGLELPGVGIDERCGGKASCGRAGGGGRIELLALGRLPFAKRMKLGLAVAGRVHGREHVGRKPAGRLERIGGFKKLLHALGFDAGGKKPFNIRNEDPAPPDAGVGERCAVAREERAHGLVAISGEGGCVRAFGQAVPGAGDGLHGGLEACVQRDGFEGLLRGRARAVHFDAGKRIGGLAGLLVEEAAEEARAAVGIVGCEPFGGLHGGVGVDGVGDDDGAVVKKRGAVDGESKFVCGRELALELLEGLAAPFVRKAERERKALHFVRFGKRRKIHSGRERGDARLGCDEKRFAALHEGVEPFA